LTTVSRGAGQEPGAWVGDVQLGGQQRIALGRRRKVVRGLSGDHRCIVPTMLPAGTVGPCAPTPTCRLAASPGSRLKVYGAYTCRRR
jgi:hypothetical protein